ncbi:MAG: sigma-54 dependent transcriptional regulator [Pyrinomonadaceae bacterium]|nr:sigma-54 dependent transcriptional regulator [Pyrinomonadaceae bacterium]MCX7639815.1 sigma-54 dependent transcriptional regulator [Pyrinomonadaceae bacterium]MDW8304398.1 sigma-54 dependent transcriptional regulator [Acidobacteriota bacterium]
MKIIESWYNRLVDFELHALIIDDDPQICNLIADILKTVSWETRWVSTFEDTIKALEEREWALIFCDVMLEGKNGYTILRYFVEKRLKGHFVLMSGYGSAAGALDATAIGAHDYLIKPFLVDEILKIAEEARQRYISQILQEEISEKESAYISDIPLIGKSPKFVECLKIVGRIAKTNLPVLITGESGTGKEIVAKAIHQKSNRADKPFVVVNCGAVPTELIESELFGHVKGSFTGADRDRKGLWEEANEGTIFLDEITETSLSFQVKLLRVLQENELRPVGSNQTKKVNTRVIAATNKNIEEEVRQGRFRQDLMYRLNAINIHLPPLRERLEDIRLLAEYFLSKIEKENGKKLKLSEKALEVLKNYHWPGNIRELENVILRAASLAENVIRINHLPEKLTATQTKSSQEISMTEIQLFEKMFKKESGEWFSLNEMQKKYAKIVLASTNGNKQAAARQLKIDRKTLTKLIN